MAVVLCAGFKNEVVTAHRLMTLEGEMKGLMAHTAAVPVFGINEYLHVTIWSQTMAEVTGWSSAEAIGHNIILAFVTQADREESENVGHAL